MAAQQKVETLIAGEQLRYDNKKAEDTGRISSFEMMNISSEVILSFRLELWLI